MRRIPSRAFKPGGMVNCAPREIPLLVHQAHVIKHPFGLHALMEQRGQKERGHWNAEGWTDTVPPTITVEERRKATTAILLLNVNGEQCRVPRVGHEEYSGTVESDWEGCYRCATAVAKQCADIVEGVAETYRGFVDSALGVLDGSAGAPVLRAKLSSLIWKAARAPERLDGLTILTVGWSRAADNAKPVARINRWDGIRCEFVFDGTELKWRTTYRHPPRTLATQLSFLMDYAETPATPLRLSDLAIVPRRWLEGSGAWS